MKKFAPLALLLALGALAVGCEKKATEPAAAPAETTAPAEGAAPAETPAETK